MRTPLLVNTIVGNLLVCWGTIIATKYNRDNSGTLFYMLKSGYWYLSVSVVISLFKSVRSARGVVCVFVVGYLYLYYHRCSFNSYK